MKADGDGDLLAHYAVSAGGRDGRLHGLQVGRLRRLRPTGTRSTWSVQKLRWIAGSASRWSGRFDSDWKPEPLELAGWEPVFLPAISGDDLYVPGLGGTVHRVSKETGVARRASESLPGRRPEPLRRGRPGRRAGRRPSSTTSLGLAADGPRSRSRRLARARSRPDGRRGARRLRDARARRARARRTPAGAVFVSDSDQRPWPPSHGRRAALGPLRRAAARHQRRARDRARRHDLHAEPRPRQRPLRVPRRGPPRPDAGLGGVAARDPERRLRRSAPERRLEPAAAGPARTPASIPRPTTGPPGASATRARPRPSCCRTARCSSAHSPSYNFSRGHLFKFERRRRRSGDLRLRLGHHPGGPGRTTEPTRSLLKDNHYSSPNGDACYDITSLDAEPRARVVVSRDEHRELRAADRTARSSCVERSSRRASSGASTSRPSTRPARVYLNSEDGIALRDSTAHGRGRGQHLPRHRARARPTRRSRSGRTGSSTPRTTGISSPSARRVPVGPRRRPVRRRSRRRASSSARGPSKPAARAALPRGRGFR